MVTGGRGGYLPLRVTGDGWLTLSRSSPGSQDWSRVSLDAATEPGWDDAYANAASNNSSPAPWKRPCDNWDGVVPCKHHVVWVLLASSGKRVSAKAMQLRE